MKNSILIFTSIIVFALVVWLIFQGDTANYTVEINDEVTALETELAEIQAAVEAGTLTPEEAAEAQINVASRLDAINSTIAGKQNVKLTDLQRSQLLGGLERLKQVLTKYQSTLVVVDETVLQLPESERPRLNPRGSRSSSRNSVVNIIQDIIETVEDHVEDVVEDYIPDDSVDEVSTTENMSDDPATSTDSASDEPSEDSEAEDSTLEDEVSANAGDAATTSDEATSTEEEPAT